MSAPDGQKINDLLRQAYQAQANGKWVEAVKIFGQVINLVPDEAPIYVQRGLLLKEMGRTDAARQDFDKAIRLDPNYGLAYYGRGWVRSASGDYQGELMDAKRGLSLDSKNAGMYYRRIGSALTGLKQYEDAVDAYNHAIELNGDKDEGTIYNRGRCYARMGKLDLALADFSRCLVLDPDWAWAFAARGDIYMRQDKPELAINDFNQAIRYDPAYSPAHAGLAQAKAKLAARAGGDWLKDSLQKLRKLWFK